ncbi:MAG: GNAT family N-acetyltransferase [Nonomuraea sp.]|nr:GNAT family N-acetyltransferase [Nonomuraea sp.]
MNVREATPADLAGLPDIERACDRVFEQVGIVFPPGPPVIEDVIAAGSPVLVAGEPPVGFAGLIELDGRVHLEQLAVLPEHGRRGIGGALVEAACARGGEVTLLTYRDVPWNAPFYARHGFTEFPAERWGPGLRAHWRAEIDAGLHALGPRLAMIRSSGPGG